MNNDYVGQFVLSKQEISSPHGFCAHELGAWTLHTHNSLPVMGVYTLDNVKIGWAIGHWIDIGKEELVTERLVVPINSIALLSWTDAIITIEEFLYSFGGRFVFVLVNKDLQRVYLDAAGSMSCVYSTNAQTLASTPGLILSDDQYATDLDEDLYRTLGMPGKGWYPFGLTAHTSIGRLLPNHYLDMEKWLPVRHWPRDAEIGVGCDTNTSVRTIGDVIQSSIRAILKHYPVYLTLTAGRDSRTLLACSKDLANRIEFITFVRNAETVDEFIAVRLAERLKLNWTRIPIKYSSEAQKEHWLREIGHCIGGAILDIHQTLASLQADHVILPGVGTEVHKAHYYRAGDKHQDLTSAILLRRMKLPHHQKLLDAGERWLDGVGYIKDVSQLLGVAHIEQRLGCWGGAQTYGQVAYVSHLFPSIHRTTFTHMLALPAEYKKSKNLTQDIMQALWPELLDLPFNEYVGISKWYEKVNQIRRMPARLLRKVIGDR